MANLQVLCPYCAEDLKVKPQRKKKCPSCMRSIYVKSTPSDREKRLMTETEADQAEREWSAYHLRQRSISILQMFGLGETDLENERAQGMPTDSDAIVAILKRVALSSKKIQERKMAYKQLALYAAEKGMPFHGFLVEATRCELLYYKQSRVITKVKILGPERGNSCSACETQAKKVFSIDEALHFMPLPCPNCTCMFSEAQSGFCGCTWKAVFD